ncbi:MAG: hypothetical protein ACREMU_09310 [Gemmatimonadaceae bacterium]
MTTPRYSAAAASRGLAIPVAAAVGMLAFAASWAIVDGIAPAGIHHFGGWEIVFGRYSVHLAIVLVLWARRAPWRTAHLRTQLVRSAMMLAMPASFIMALSRGVSSAAVLRVFWCAPLIVVGVGAILDRRRASRLSWAAGVLGWAAAWVYYEPASAAAAATRGSLIFGGAMAASFAVYVAMTRALRDEPLRVNLFYTALVPWAALGLLMPHVWVTPTSSELVTLLLIGAIGWVGLLALDRAEHAAQTAASGPLIAVQPALIAALLAFVGQGPPLSRLLLFTALFLPAMALGLLGLARSSVENLA